MNPRTSATREVLDIGCGLRKEGTVNVDIDVKVRPDVRCDMYNLPFRENIFHEVILTQVLEHTSNPEKLLKEYWRVTTT